MTRTLEAARERARFQIFRERERESWCFTAISSLSEDHHIADRRHDFDTDGQNSYPVFSQLEPTSDVISGTSMSYYNIIDNAVILGDLE